MKKIILLTICLFFTGINAFSQDLPEERINKYNEFMDFIANWSNWYFNLWVSREWEAMDSKYYSGKFKKRQFNNSTYIYLEKMTELYKAAVEKAKSDFNKRIQDSDFTNDTKSIIERMYKSEGLLADWTRTPFEEYGFPLKKYNYSNIEMTGYTITLFYNFCKYYDQKTNDYAVTDTMMERMKRNLREIRTGNGG